MADLDVRPGVVAVAGYGGDTLTIAVTAPASIVDGMEWSAEVRVARSDAVPVAVFAVTPPAVADGPAYLTLSSADTARLTTTGSYLRIKNKDGSTRMVQQFAGEWDCQVSAAGADPVRTLVQGTISLEADVTRPGAA